VHGYNHPNIYSYRSNQTHSNHLHYASPNLILSFSNLSLLFRNILIFFIWTISSPLNSIPSSLSFHISPFSSLSSPSSCFVEREEGGGIEADCKILIVFSMPFNFVRSASTSCSARFRSFVISGLRREDVEDRWVEIVVWGRTRNFWSCQLIDPHLTEIRNHEDDYHCPLISLGQMIMSIEDQGGTTYMLINQYPIQPREILNPRTELIQCRS